MKIICIMAAYKRAGITLQTLELLKKQTYPLHKIIIVGSDRVDGVVAQKAGLDCIFHKNQPLSDKWQAGVDYARQFNPDAIMICGSDSWLSINWCETARKHLNDFDMFGTKNFYTCYLVPGKRVKIIGRAYRTRKDPAGSGRIISSEILDKIDWQMYPKAQRHSMDGLSFKKLGAQKIRLKVFYDEDDVALLSVKSTAWHTMTSFEHVDKHRMFVALPDIEDKKDWMEKYFPGSTTDLKKLVPGIKWR